MKSYEFDPSFIGTTERGRGTLGTMIGLEMHRLMYFSLRDVLEKRYGTRETDGIVFETGKLAGSEFYKAYMEGQALDTVDDFVAVLQKKFTEYGMGILRFEESEPEHGRFIVAIDENFESAGLPRRDFESCIFSEGFLVSVFECYTKKAWTASEVDCWCAGAKTCRFVVTES